MSTDPYSQRAMARNNILATAKLWHERAEVLDVLAEEYARQGDTEYEADLRAAAYDYRNAAGELV